MRAPYPGLGAGQWASSPISSSSAPVAPAISSNRGQPGRVDRGESSLSFDGTWLGHVCGQDDRRSHDVDMRGNGDLTGEGARRAWAQLEPYGLRAVGIILAAVGIAVVIIALTRSAQDELRPVYLGFGSALVVAGLCASARIREDLVTEITAGLTAALFAVTLVITSVRINSRNAVLLTGVMATLTVLVRVFRGGFRANRPPR
jgi:hypothetical protein